MRQRCLRRRRGFLPSRRRQRCVRRGLASPSGLWVQSCRSHSRCLDARPLSFTPDSSVSTVCLVTRLRWSSRRRRLRGARHRGVRCTDAAFFERRNWSANVVCTYIQWRCVGIELHRSTTSAHSIRRSSSFNKGRSALKLYLCCASISSLNRTHQPPAAAAAAAAAAGAAFNADTTLFKQGLTPD